MERTRRDAPSGAGKAGRIGPGLVGAVVTAVIGLVHLRDGLSLPELAAVSAADRSWHSALVYGAKFSSRSAASTFVLRAWMTLGRSDLTLRVLPVLLAAASVALVARLATVIAGRPAAVIATTVFVLDAAVVWTFDLATPLVAMPAALLVCLSFVQLLRRPTMPVLLAWSATAAVLVAAEPFAVVLPVAQVLVLIIASLIARSVAVRRVRVAMAAVIGLGPSLAVAAAISWSVRHYAQPRAAYGIPVASRDAIVAAARELGLPGGTIGLAGAAVGLAFLALALLQNEGPADGLAASPDQQFVRFAVAVSSAAPVLVALLAALVDPASTSRDVRFCVGPLVAVVGHGLAELRPRRWGGAATGEATRWLVRAGLGMILVWALAATLNGARSPRHDRAWRSLARQVFASAKADDGLVVVPGDARLALERYLPADASRRPAPLEPIDPWGGFDLRTWAASEPAPLAVVGERARDTRSAVWVIDARTSLEPASESAKALGLVGPPDVAIDTPVGTARRYRVR